MCLLHREQNKSFSNEERAGVILEFATLKKTPQVENKAPVSRWSLSMAMQYAPTLNLGTIKGGSTEP